MLGGPVLRLGIPIERLSIPPGTGWSEKDTSWLATCECPLRTDSASWKSLESFIQLISFCNYCILPINSRIISRSSINVLLAKKSKEELWNFFNSSISLRLFSWAARRSHFCFNSCSWRNCWSCRRRWYPWWARQNFVFLRLDRFIQLLNTSVVIGLEFVFSNLCLTVSENLLSLSLSFLDARNLWTKWANNGSPRSIMTDWRRQTRRQAYFFRVIGSSSASIAERLADCNVIVVEIIGRPLLTGGLLGVFDISLRDEVVVGLITCGRLVLGQGAKVLSGSARACYPRHQGSRKCKATRRARK